MILMISHTFVFNSQANNIRQFDFGGDAIADLSLYHAALGNWAVSLSDSATPIYRQWGWIHSYSVPGDYDGDGKADIAVHYPPTGEWFIINSRNNVSRKIIWGWAETIPVPADYDGDGITDIAVYHPAGGNWYIYESSKKLLRLQNWGWDKVRPVPADYDGDGKIDLAVYNPPEGMWHIRYSSGGSLVKNWGWDKSIPVPADYDGDKKADLAVMDPAICEWFIYRSTTKILHKLSFNFDGTIPVVSRYNKDVYSDIGFYQPKSGTWGIYLMGINTPVVRAWGGPDHRPAANWYWTIYDKSRFESNPSNPPPTNNPAIPADQLNVTNAKLLGTHKNVKPENAAVTRRLRSANVEGSSVRLDYETLNWPANSPIGDNIDGRVYIFWLENGLVTGGHFEWKRPGQTVKGLSNIENGYLEGKKPPRGATVWFCLLNNEGTERTNVVQSKTPY